MRRIWTLLLALTLCLTGLIPLKAAAAETNPLVLQSETKNGITFRYSYDQKGNCVRKEWTNKKEYAEEYSYLSSGVMIRKRVYENGKLNRQTNYDTKGNATSYWLADKTGKLVKETVYTNYYDDFGRISTIFSEDVSSSLHSMESVRYEYRDNPDSPDAVVTDAISRYHESYTQTDSDTGETYYIVSMMQTYDDEGRIIEDRDAVEGRRILWEYDEQGNVLRKTDMLESYEYASIETSEYENIYNKKGQLEEARIHTTVQTDLYGDCETQEYDDVIKYKYDARGRKISEESCYDSGLASTEIWRYDSRGRMTYREYHSGTWDITQTWTYDRYGNLLKTTRDGKVETQYTYVPLNQALWKK